MMPQETVEHVPVNGSARTANFLANVTIHDVLRLTLAALSARALRWTGLLLSFSLFAYTAARADSDQARLLASMLFAGVVLALWFKKEK